jgi:hypothetical protein
MQLTVEFDDADQIATLAHLAEIIDLSRKNDTDKMHTLYPRSVIDAVRSLMEAFDNVLSHIDSPYEVSENVGNDAGSLAHRMREISGHILEMKTEFEKKRTDK